ncbi:MAG: dienelactone hydrolase family protein [Planctomycetes bacterium]|nr:dienelactone hydrolase family protein [Planctomycetota bacterium]
MIEIPTGDGRSMPGYLATPASTPAPGLILIQEIFGINAVMRNLTDALAKKGFVVLCPDLFWRTEPGIELSDSDEKDRARAFDLYGKLDEAEAAADCGAALNLLRAHDACSGGVGALGYCLGGKLAYLVAARHNPTCAVGYYGVGIEKALDEASNIECPLMLHVAEKDAFCPPAAQAQLHDAFSQHKFVTMHTYADRDHAFARVGGEHFDEAAAELANLRSIDFLRDHLCQGAAGEASSGEKFAALWEEHIKYEFETRDYVDTLETMVEDAYVNHIPTLTGGVGKAQLSEFYSKRFIPQMPPDTEMTAVSRTIGEDRLVDEMIFKFTHTIEMDWMLPGVKPTGKRVEVPLVAIVHFRGDKLAHEHIYWDQASVLVQLGLIDPSRLPVMGIETAQKVLDNSIPSNALIDRADRWRSQE